MHPACISWKMSRPPSAVPPVMEFLEVINGHGRQFEEGNGNEKEGGGREKGAYLNLKTYKISNLLAVAMFCYMIHDGFLRGYVTL